MSNATEWFDLLELDKMIKGLNYFKNYRVKYHYHLSVEIYCENASREFNFENLLYDLETIKEFFCHSNEQNYTLEEACFRAYFRKEEIKGYAAANVEA